MKNSKKGISLIVLVITIIVIIILAAAVLLTLNNNNPINNANTAVEDSDIAEAQSAVTIWISAIMAEQKASVSFTGTLGTSAVTPSAANLKISGTAYDASTNALTTEAKTVFDANTVSDLGLSALKSVVIENNKVTSVTK